MAKKSPIIRMLDGDSIYRDAPEGAVAVQVGRVTLKVHFRDGSFIEKVVDGILFDHIYPSTIWPWSRSIRYGRYAKFMAAEMIRIWKADKLLTIMYGPINHIIPWHQVVRIEERIEPLELQLKERQ